MLPVLGLRLRENVCETPPKDAVTTAVRLDVMVPAAAEKVTMEEPDGTVTLGGTVNWDELLVSVTTDPDEGAACDNTTVQVVMP